MIFRIFLLFLFSTQCIFTQSLPDSTLQLIIGEIEDFSDNTQFSIAIVDGDVTAFVGYLKNGKEWQVIDNSKSFFEIGSISKVFTCIILSGMAEDSTVNLDDPVSKYLDITFDDPRVGEIRLTDLANHTSGLPRLPMDFSGDPTNPYSKNDTAVLWESLRKTKLLTNPGEKMAYSNFGMAILAQILSEKAGKSYEELLHLYAFDLCHMTQATTIRSTLDSNKVVVGLGTFGTPTPYWDFNAYEGIGAIFSNTTDLVHFIQSNFQPPTHLAAIRKATHSEQGNVSIGLGIMRVERENPIFWHNGGTGGFRSCMAFDVDNKKGVIVLSNVSAFNAQSVKIDQLCFKLLQSLY